MIQMDFAHKQRRPIKKCDEQINMPSPEEQLQQKLAKLKNVFVSQLPEKIESLQNHWDSLAEQKWSTDAIQAFHLIVHSLIGTSGTFGFTELSNKARELETLVKTLLASQQTPSQEDIDIIEHAFSSLCSEMLEAPDDPEFKEPLTNIITPNSPDSTKVLIVDDDTILTNITAEHLRLHGFTVETLDHPAKLIEIVNKFQPSIILMDMIFNESRLAGAAAIEVLRENNNNTPVIFISVNHDMSSRLNAIRTGAFSYLTKPLNLDLLISNIRTACNIKPDLPYRVLIIDDDAALLEAHTQALISHGMLVHSLSNPMQTLNVIDEFKPEIIVLDMHMPECSGLEVAMTIRQSSELDDIPIIFVSSEEDISIRLMTIKCGSDDFIVKPVNLDYLARAIQARVEKARKLIESRNIDKMTINKIAASKKLAERANKTKSEFISNMSHELRTPLNTILGYTQLLEIDHDKNLTDAQSSNIQHILNSGWHLLALINDVLDISKIEIGHLSLASTETNLNAVIKKAIELSENDASNKSISISYDNECQHKASVYADETRLKQVLVNILSNAIKYNVENGNVRISVNAEQDGVCKVTISDSGRGLPEDKIDNLFKPFNRLGLEDTSIEGNGIGLALSSQLIELMNGKIGAYNNEDEGASFWFTLNKYTQPENIQLNDKFVIKVLYIEKNNMDFELVSQSLAAQPNIELFTACDAESALNMAHKMLPDVILLNIELSSMDGTTMLNALRTNQHLKQVPVFALSSDEIPNEQQILGDELFYKYFSKPYNINLLITAIGDVLEKKHPTAATLGH